MNTKNNARITMPPVNREEFIKTFIEVDIHPDDFLIVKETLSRIGIASKKKLPNGTVQNVLNQTCHIFHKRGKYYIVHFKELFRLDNRLYTPITTTDYNRRNLIAYLLEKWDLLSIVSPFNREQEFPSFKKLNLTIVPYNQKHNWKFEPKYMIGKFNYKKRYNSQTTEEYDVDDLEEFDNDYVDNEEYLEEENNVNDTDVVTDQNQDQNKEV